VLPSLVAGLLWVPLTLGVVAAARRFPPLSLPPASGIDVPAFLGHLAASLSVSFVLNGCFLAIMDPALVLVPVAFAENTLRLGLAYLHLNLGTYWVLTAGTLGWARMSRRGTPDQPTRDQVLTVRSGTRTIPVPVAEIRWIEAAGDYVTLHLAGARHLLSERLKSLEKRLDPARFVRVHRSAIVNVEAVRSLKHLGHGDYEAGLDEGSTVRISRTRRAKLQALLEERELPPADDDGD